MRLQFAWFSRFFPRRDCHCCEQIGYNLFCSWLVIAQQEAEKNSTEHLAKIKFSKIVSLLIRVCKVVLVSADNEQMSTLGGAGSNSKQFAAVSIRDGGFDWSAE